MAGVYKVILVGHLGKDPEIRRLENGAAVAIAEVGSRTYRRQSIDRGTAWRAARIHYQRRAANGNEDPVLPNRC